MTFAPCLNVLFVGGLTMTHTQVTQAHTITAPIAVQRWTVKGERDEKHQPIEILCAVIHMGASNVLGGCSGVWCAYVLWL